MDQRTLDKIKSVKAKHEKDWLKIDEVVGIGIGLIEDDRPGIIISVKSGVNSVRRQMPTQVDGVSIAINESGEIRAE